MPWYYAGPEAKPIGPLSTEELHARHASGTVTAETYVIEHTGQASADWTWKRYRDVFPSASTLPPVPPLSAPPAPAVMPAPPAVPPQVNPPHPLFPSAASAQPSVFPSDTRPDPYYKIRPTNGWCAWGFGLGLAGFFFSFMCGVGVLLAIPSLLLCIVGLAQVQKNREQSGQGLAIAGLILSGVALLISLAFIITFAVPMIKAHEWTVTEQTSNDSE